MFLRRSLLNVPAHDARKLLKSLGAAADTIVIDLEDGVPVSQKRAAIEGAQKFAKEQLGSPKHYRKEFALRVNSLSSNAGKEDIMALSGILSQFNSIVFPKISTLADVDEVNKITGLYGIKPFLCIESPLGLCHLGRILEKSVNTQGLIFGAEDYCAISGIKRSIEGKELLYARSKIVNYAKAFGIEAIDMVCINFRDKDMLKEESLDGATLGFTGKQVIHPDQIEIVNNAFGPTTEEVDRAERIINEYEKCIDKGRGAFDFEGKVVDLPVVEQARTLLKRKTFIEECFEDHNSR